MLKKLRIKFIITTMVIATAMLCTIFGMMYHFTKVNLENESIAMMKNIAEKPINPPGEHREEILLPYFSVRLGGRGEILSTSGYYDLSDTEFLNAVIADAIKTNLQTGILPAYGLRFCRNISPFDQTFVFVDMSSEQATLQNLVQISVLIGVVSFIAFLGISILLAKWAVAPVDKAWKQQQQFISDASHELKTPLTVIMANAELLENAASEENKLRYTENILTISRQMCRLLEQMLTLARSDNNTRQTPFAPTDLSRLTADAVLPFEPVFFEKALPLESSIAPDICVNGAEGQLRQVVDILLDNAQKYAAPGGKTWLTLRRVSRNRCILSVANEGAAIPPAHLEKLFTRFYRQDEARSRDGSFGLGLSIAESIVLAHKGKIRAGSEGGVNTFSVELPTT